MLDSLIKCFRYGIFRHIQMQGNHYFNSYFARRKKESGIADILTMVLVVVVAAEPK